MILETTYDLYMSFLDGIKKYGTGSVNPEAFNRIINDWGQDEWIRRTVRKGPEITQEIQDKLSVLRVITDGVYTYSEHIDLSSQYVLKPIPANDKVVSFTNIKGVSSPNAFPLSDKYFSYPMGAPITVNGVKYPPYLRLLGVAFKLEYVDNVCGLTGISDWLDAKVLRSDQKSVITKNPFRKPTDDRLYYEIINENFVLTNNTKSEGYSMRLDYLKYPRRIFFNTNDTNPREEQTGIPDYTGTTPGSVNCELPNNIKQEIVDLAVMVFIERVKDPRYQTFINELNIKQNG
jgi:hypothetical protein